MSNELTSLSLLSLHYLLLGSKWWQTILFLCVLTVYLVFSSILIAVESQSIFIILRDFYHVDLVKLGSFTLLENTSFMFPLITGLLAWYKYFINSCTKVRHGNFVSLDLHQQFWTISEKRQQWFQSVQYT